MGGRERGEGVVLDVKENGERERGNCKCKQVGERGEGGRS